MAQYLTLPAAADGDLSQARLHDTETLAGLVNGTAYICYRLSAPSAPFTPVGQSVLVLALTISPVAPVVGEVVTLTGTLTGGAASTYTAISATVGGVVQALSGTGLTRTFTVLGAGTLAVMATVSVAGQTVSASASVAIAVPATGPTLRVRDAVILDPQPLQEGATDAIGVDGNGWTADVIIPGVTNILGAVDATKLVLTVRDPGFDTTGAVTTVTRTIRGRVNLRRQYPNFAQRMITSDGENLSLTVALDDWVYGGSTIVSAVFEAGFYPGVAAQSLSFENASVLAYPKPIWAWHQPQNEPAGANHSVEGVAFHRHATGGQQVACVTYDATDGTHLSPTVTVAEAVLSVRNTSGQRPEVWKGTLDLSAMTANAVTNVNARVYPWLGDASAVLDLFVDGVSWPTPLPCTRLRVVHTPAPTYAYVKNGAVGGSVSGTIATAKAAPFPTIQAAFTAVAAWNNTNRGHNTLSGSFVRLMDDEGSDAVYDIATSPGGTRGASVVTLEADPEATGRVTYSISANGAFVVPSNIKVRGLTLANSRSGATTTMFYPSVTDSSYLVFEDVDLNLNNPTTLVSTFVITPMFNVVRLSGTINPGNFTNASGVTSMFGCAVTAVEALGNGVLQLPCAIGNDLPGSHLGQPAFDGMVAYNNKFQGVTLTSSSAALNSRGAAYVQNLTENNSASVGTLNMLADGDVTTITNFVEMHNSSFGERASRMYNDVASTRIGPAGVLKQGVSKYSIYDNYNLKSDTFAPTAGALLGTGNWAYTHHVGNRGLVSLFGSVQRTQGDKPYRQGGSAAGYLGEIWDESSEYSVLGNISTQADVMALFENYTTRPKASPTYGGNYRPKATSVVLKNRVPAGRDVLKYDLSGMARKTDGTGAAGALEASA